MLQLLHEHLDVSLELFLVFDLLMLEVPLQAALLDLAQGFPQEKASRLSDYLLPECVVDFCKAELAQVLGRDLMFIPIPEEEVEHLLGAYFGQRKRLP